MHTTSFVNFSTQNLILTSSLETMNKLVITPCIYWNCQCDRAKINKCLGACMPCSSLTDGFWNMNHITHTKCLNFIEYKLLPFFQCQYYRDSLPVSGIYFNKNGITQSTTKFATCPRARGRRIKECEVRQDSPWGQWQTFSKAGDTGGQSW